MSDTVPKTFEAKLERIDEIVKLLDGGNVPLDKAVELYDEAKKLALECEAQLKGAQEKLDKAGQ